MVEIDKQLKNLIENNALGFATIDEDNTPHCIAVGFVKVVSKNQLLISDNYLVRCVSNIAKNPAVALVVWNQDWKDNCIGFELGGTAEYFSKGKWHEMIKKIPENKDAPCKGAILITVTRIKSLA
jgi:predicted pyridoxine 5'-phosphate oxidase superfamily flavin-nucleotide-binding protein